MTPDSSPSALRIGVSYVVVALSGVIAWLIYTKSDPAPLVVDVEAFSVFAPLYIAAQAIERFLEPFAARWSTTTTEKLTLKRARTMKDVAAVEAAELALAKAKAKRAIPLWAAASSLGLLVCSMLGLGLIAAVSATPPSGEFVRTVDVLITGLTVGAGTKPLHDLISRLEKSSDNADPATKPLGAER